MAASAFGVRPLCVACGCEVMVVTAETVYPPAAIDASISSITVHK